MVKNDRPHSTHVPVSAVKWCLRAHCSSDDMLKAHPFSDIGMPTVTHLPERFAQSAQRCCNPV